MGERIETRNFSLVRRDEEKSIVATRVF